MKITVLHGWTIDPQSRAKWHALESALQSQGFQLQILELPGLSAPLHEVWLLDNYINWLADHLKAQKDVVLLGHSFGGQIAIRYTARHADQVSKLILIDAAGVRDITFRGRVKRGVFWSMAKLGKVFFKDERLRNVLYKLARERDYQQAPPLLRQTMANVIKEEVLNDAAHILCPTLIIWGAEDRVTPLKNADQFHRAISKSTLQVVAGARHSPHFTHPDQVATLITQFLHSAANGMMF